MNDGWFFLCISQYFTSEDKIDTRINLPEEWTSSKKWLMKVKVPETERTFKTKETKAPEIVIKRPISYLKYGWVGGDTGYGKSRDFAKTNTLNEIINYLQFLPEK